MKSPWSRKWYSRRPGESYKDHEDRMLTYAAWASLLLLCFVSGILIGWWQDGKVKDPPSGKMRTEAAYRNR